VIAKSETTRHSSSLILYRIMLNSFSISTAGTSRKRFRPNDDSAPSLEAGAELISELGEGVPLKNSSEPTLVIPLPTRSQVTSAPVTLRAAKSLDASIMDKLFAPQQVRIAPTDSRKVPLLHQQVLGDPAALADSLSPQDERYDAVPVSKFGAAMLRGMGAVVKEDDEDAGGGEQGQELEKGKGGGNRFRLGVGAVTNPLLAGSNIMNGKGGSAVAELLVLEVKQQGMVGSHVAAPKTPKGLLSHPHLIPGAVVRLTGAAAVDATSTSSQNCPTPQPTKLALVLKVEGVPGLDRFLARVLTLSTDTSAGSKDKGIIGTQVSSFSINDTSPFSDDDFSSTTARERGMAQYLRSEHQREEATAAAAEKKKKDPAPIQRLPLRSEIIQQQQQQQQQGTGTSKSILYPLGAVLRVKETGVKGRVVSHSADRGGLVGLLTKGSSQPLEFGVGQVETVITKVGGCIVIVGGRVNVGERGTVAAIHEGRFCVDVKAADGRIIKDLEYEHVTKMEN